MKNSRSVRAPSPLPTTGGQETAGQTIWSGTISFSLVAIPVHLVKAVEPGRVSFRMLHSTDYSPLLRRMVCPKDGEVVPPDEIIRGYEIGPDKYILITDEELESLSPERSRTIEIVEFIDMAEVDSIYFDHPYYLVPARGGEKAYRLLVEVMRRTRKAGVAKFILGEREYLVAVKSTEGALSLVTLHYSEEILSEVEIVPSKGTIDPEEKNRLKKIIKGMTADFNPDKYADERRKKIVKLLKKKEKEQTPVEAPDVDEEAGEGPVDLIAALEESMRKVKKEPVMRQVAEVAGRRLSLSNLEKDLYPSYGFTKAHILEYYSRISRFILPHIKNRALTLKRYPEGVEKEYFFEKRCPSHRPPWVATAEIPQHDGERMTVCLVNDLHTLIWVGNLASLELHVPLARAASPGTPDSVVFDLDPGDQAGILDCARVALILRDLLSPLGLEGFVKTSGQKGLHVYVPLNRKETTFADTKKFSKSVAEVVQRNYPDLVTTNMAKEQRKKKVFINWSQNDASKTMVSVYSLRAREKPFVSFPLPWGELEELAGRGDPEKLLILAPEARNRVETEGDLFREVLVKKQKLPYL